MKAKSWVIVACCDRARVFNFEGAGKLKELDALIKPEANMMNQDLTSDKPGRAFNSMGAGTHAKDQKSSPRVKETKDFAKKLCLFLESSLRKGCFKNLYLLIEPKFLGMVRKQMSAELERVIAKQVGKDLIWLKPAEIWPHLPAY